MANTPSAGSEPALNFDQLFSEEDKAAGAVAAEEGEDLEELEAFLDEFEKNLEGGAPATQRISQETAVESPEMPDVEAATPETAPSSLPGADELPHGLLHRTDLDLDVRSEASPEPGPVAISDFEAAPLAPPAAFIQGPPDRPVETAKGVGRVGSILGLTLGGTALLVAFGAGWMAWNADNTLRSVESRVSAVTVQGSSAEATRLAHLQSDVAALKQKVDELAQVMEGPNGHLANAYAHDMEELQGRVARLESTSQAAPATGGTLSASTAAVLSPPAGPAGSEPAESAAASKVGAAWLVHLSSFDEIKRAERELSRARAAGISSEVTTVQVGGKTWYRITVRGFANPREARAYVANEAKKAGFDAAWIGSR